MNTLCLNCIFIASQYRTVQLYCGYTKDQWVLIYYRQKNLSWLNLHYQCSHLQHERTETQGEEMHISTCMNCLSCRQINILKTIGRQAILYALEVIKLCTFSNTARGDHMQSFYLCSQAVHDKSLASGCVVNMCVCLGTTPLQIIYHSIPYEDRTCICCQPQSSIWNRNDHCSSLCLLHWPL